MNILIIENSNTLAQLLSKTLESYGHNITVDTDSFSSRNLIKRNIFDFVILNSNLGESRTTEILNYLIRYKSCLKILGVCNKGGWAEKVDFLNQGGDDILTYPFPVQELLARIQSLIRRPKNYIDSRICLGDIILDTDSKTIYKEDKEVGVRRKEYELFEYLVRNSDRTVSRCELLDHVWDYREYIGSNTVDVHINRLRDKLDNKKIIETVHGIGYRVKKI